jgi:hypothetical protein
MSIIHQIYPIRTGIKRYKTVIDTTVTDKALIEETLIEKTVIEGEP